MSLNVVLHNEGDLEQLVDDEADEENASDDGDLDELFAVVPTTLRHPAIMF